MGKLLKFTGRVGTNKVGSDCNFEFEVYENDLPEDPARRATALEDMALEAMWGSGIIDWSYEQTGEEDNEEEP